MPLRRPLDEEIARGERQQHASRPRLPSSSIVRPARIVQQRRAFRGSASGRAGIGGRARALASQRAKPGTGDSVTKVFRPGRSRRKSSTTCLIRKLPNEMPRRPSWQLEIE